MAKKAAIIISIVVIAVVVATAVLLAMSCKKLSSSEVAILYNNFKKSLKEEPYQEGLYIVPLGFQFITFHSIFRTMSFVSLKCINKDGVSIHLDISFQYRVKSANLKHTVQEFKNEVGYLEVLRHTGSSVIHDSCSRYRTIQFQAERGKFQEDLTLRLVDKYEKLNCDVNELQVNDIRRPSHYDNAIRDKESAREDIEVARNEGPKWLTKSKTYRLEAKTEADMIMNEAESEARIILTRAQTDAEAILNQYQKESDSYKSLKDANNLDSQGFLAYLGVRVVANAKNPVHVGLKAPAKSSYV